MEGEGGRRRRSCCRWLLVSGKSWIYLDPRGSSLLRFPSSQTSPGERGVPAPAPAAGPAPHPALPCPALAGPRRRCLMGSGCRAAPAARPPCQHRLPIAPEARQRQEGEPWLQMVLFCLPTGRGRSSPAARRDAAGRPKFAEFAKWQKEPKGAAPFPPAPSRSPAARAGRPQERGRSGRGGAGCPAPQRHLPAATGSPEPGGCGDREGGGSCRAGGAEGRGKDLCPIHVCA